MLAASPPTLTDTYTRSETFPKAEASTTLMLRPNEGVTWFDGG
jgi:hypothetical protein